MNDERKCGWLSSYPTLRQTPSHNIIISLQDFLNENNPSQWVSWEQSIPIVQRETGIVVTASEMAKQFNAVLEYELPREGGRRPDVVALQNGVVVVIEFKGYSGPRFEHLDQVDAYARDLKNYHEMSHDLEIIPVLIPTGYRGERQKIGNVWLLPPHDLGRFLLEQAHRSTGTIIEAEEWVNSPYCPLPTLVTAARLLFQHQELPRIKRAHNARIPDIVDFILSKCHQAAANKTRHIIFLTGTPGSGKTLVGLQLAHSDQLEDLRVVRKGTNGGAPAVFLSGNGPLVQVLQDALGSRAFVDGMKKFVEYYAFKRPTLIPSEHVLIFDEAQRAWDEQQMELKHNKRISEPEALLQIANRIPEWCVVVALVGEGQEIHKGEEAGLVAWRSALNAIPNHEAWKVCGPKKLDSIFSRMDGQYNSNDLLNLETNLRTHVASNLDKWVGTILSNRHQDPSYLRRMADTLRAETFPIYVTRSLEQARSYLKERYRDSINSRYGLLASRYAKNLRPLGVDNTYHFQRAEQLQVGPWFNQVQTHPLSCCALSRPATEFECQGLELDFSVVCWGDDLLWNGTEWHIEIMRRRSVQDAIKVTFNAYRVLLTRARDGMCIFIPNGNDTRYDATYNHFVDSGCAVLR